MNPALLVIDLQRWFLERGDREKLDGVATLIARTNELIDYFQAKKLPVVLVRLVHQADGSTWNQRMIEHWTGEPIKGTLVEGTWEADWHPDLHTDSRVLTITKTRVSAFLRTELEALLRARDVDAIVLAGYSIDRCVGLTAIDAWERDFKVVLAGDAVLGMNQTEGDLMLDYLRKAFAIVPVANAVIMKIVGGQDRDSISAERE